MKLRSIAALLRYHEGECFLAYDDATGALIQPGHTVIGHPTIGYGRALDTNGVSREEAELLLRHDIRRVTEQLTKRLPWLGARTAPRRAVVISMGYNLGVKGLLKFRKTLLAIEREDYRTAAVEMLSSKWAEQVGDRALMLAAMMDSGQWPDDDDGEATA